MKSAFRSADDLAEAIVSTIGTSIVLGLPIGIGKSIRIADALYRRAVANPSINLKIFTGLSLEVPRGRSDLERRFLEPLTKRLYDGWPLPEYVAALRRNALPSNVQVREFYLRPGAFLNNPSVQQSYTSLNYSQVARELMALGVNVIAQLVARRLEDPTKLSLSSNPEITLDLIQPPDGQPAPPILLAGEIHPALPYMTGDAELPAQRFDLLLDDGQSNYPLFALPNRRVTPADYAAAMHVASLVADGGTIQVGIGSMSDAVAHCLAVRHQNPEVFDNVLRALPGGSDSPRRQALPVELGPFEEGLFASSELLSDALFSLFEKGIVKREAGAGDKATVHAGFFIGSGQLYSALNALTEDARARIRMTRISEVNSLFGDETRKRTQRRNARFINETMMVTLLGAAVSDGLEDGRVVSGVGGQFDFVRMAHALPDAHSVLMFRARRESNGGVQSNLRWSYGHTTVPRHCRDVYVSEYGIAATRGLPDSEVISALLGIADSAFQDELLDQARGAGKIPPGYSIPLDARENTPEAVSRVFLNPDVAEHFPPFPLGTALSDEETALALALPWLGNTVKRPVRNAGRLLAALLSSPAEGDAAALTRMRLGNTSGFKENAYRRLLGYALRKTQGPS